MVLTSNYYNPTGVLRWNLGWASPTFSGAFLATLIPYAWALRRLIPRNSESPSARSFRAAWVLATALAIGLLFLLCKTQSRGALLGAVAAGLYWHSRYGKGVRWRTLAAQAAVLIACIWLAGFSSRIEPGYLSGDISIHNRLRLWKGCLQVFGASPIGGCGAGSSGRLYRAWFQPLDWSQWYPDPINSYLHVGIEYGAAVLALLLGLLFFAIFVGALGDARRGRRPHPASLEPQEPGVGQTRWVCRAAPIVAAAAGASALAWVTASLFSSLWTEPHLWIVPGLSIALAAAGASRRCAGPAAAALGAALLLVATVKTAGWRMAQSEAIVPEFYPGGSARVRVSGRERTSWPVCHVWLDPGVLGADSERELRKWLAREGSPRELVVHARVGDAAPEPADGDAVILFGRNAERLGQSLNRRYARLVLVAPSAPYRDSLPLPPGAVVVLPGIDQDGNLEGLREAARRAGSAIAAPGLGDDLRADWPALMDRVAARYAKEAMR